MSSHEEMEDPSPLTGLPAELSPPAALESRVVEALQRRGHLRRRPLRAWAVLAASLLGLAGGWWLRGEARSPAPLVASRAPLFLLLLSGEPPRGPQGEARVDAYRTWARGLAAEGRLAGAEKLVHAGVLVDESALAASTLDDASPTGFFLVRARNLDEAIAIARASPHVRFGGRVTVRPIDPT
jgi:hypothetical protein